MIDKKNHLHQKMQYDKLNQNLMSFGLKWFISLLCWLFTFRHLRFSFWAFWPLFSLCLFVFWTLSTRACTGPLVLSHGARSARAVASVNIWPRVVCLGNCFLVETYHPHVTVFPPEQKHMKCNQTKTSRTRGHRCCITEHCTIGKTRWG